MTNIKSNMENKPNPVTKLTFDETEIFSFVENRFYVDGGAMYGVIPKKLWSRLTHSDENNLIPLDTNVILIKSSQKSILIDCGIGDYLSDKERKLYSCTTLSKMEDCIRQLGLSCNDIDIVIPTHLHLDHIGGAFIAGPDGNAAPRFPNARHIIRKQEWNDAMNPDDRSRAAYPSDRLKSLEESGLIDFVEYDSEVFPGIKVIQTGGHTRGHQAVIITSDNKSVICCGDIIPTVGNLRPTYIAASDLFPLDTLEHKKRLSKDVIEKNWIIAFDHDTEYKFATLRREDGKVIPEKAGEYTAVEN